MCLHSSRLSTSISTSESSCGGGLPAAEDGGQEASGAGGRSSSVALLLRGLELALALSPGGSPPLGWEVLGTDGDIGPIFPRGRGVRATFGATAFSRLL